MVVHLFSSKFKKPRTSRNQYWFKSYHYQLKLCLRLKLFFFFLKLMDIKSDDQNKVWFHEFSWQILNLEQYWIWNFVYNSENLVSNSVLFQLRSIQILNNSVESGTLMQSPKFSISFTFQIVSYPRKFHKIRKNLAVFPFLALFNLKFQSSTCVSVKSLFQRLQSFRCFFFFGNE